MNPAIIVISVDSLSEVIYVHMLYFIIDYSANSYIVKGQSRFGPNFFAGRPVFEQLFNGLASVHNIVDYQDLLVVEIDVLREPRIGLSMVDAFVSRGPVNHDNRDAATMREQYSRNSSTTNDANNVVRSKPTRSNLLFDLP